MQIRKNPQQCKEHKIYPNQKKNCSQKGAQMTKISLFENCV